MISFIKVGSPALQRILNNPAFLKRISKTVKLNYDFDIPYLAGYAKNGRIIYIDRHLKTKWKYRGRIVDIVDFLLVHEVTEKALIDLFKFNYQKAHHLAQHFESLACRQHGVNWRIYSKYLKLYIKIAKNKKIQKVPSDLDLTPYRDSDDQKTLMALQAGKNNC